MLEKSKSLELIIAINSNFNIDEVECANLYQTRILDIRNTILHSVYDIKPEKLSLLFLYNLKKSLGKSDTLKVVFIHGSNLEKSVLDEHKSEFGLKNINFDISEEPGYKNPVKFETSILKLRLSRRLKSIKLNN